MSEYCDECGSPTPTHNQTCVVNVLRLERELAACQAELARERELLRKAGDHLNKSRYAPSKEIICCCRRPIDRDCHYCVAGQISERIDAALKQESTK